jgi:hypothetical protein
MVGIVYSLCALLWASTKTVSNNRDLKCKIHSFFGYRYRQRVQYLFLVFPNNKIQMTTLSANESLGERILIFGLCLS